ncbi:disulfide isomerase [Ephemerocybe angulata]|uniref:Disulfide isomerase n=1 Tax=Ephemerocybe angulata TaxID=980116 RepID=A0A8H6M5Z2_9AGAR|nr:disulfide isomerase [Tulosesus angulatus]
MVLPSSLLMLALSPLLAQAALFPKSSKVKMLDAKGFKKAMEINGTSLVAFVAPWCGHCQRMVPEYSKAAESLHPLIPAYAVDCDEESNKRLCSEQGVKGFPTVKLFPRGKHLAPMPYEGERTASGFFKYASLRVPNGPDKIMKPADIKPWIAKHKQADRALLLTKDSKVPLLWKVLASKYHGKLRFGTHRDDKGLASAEVGLELGESKGSKVLIYSSGSQDPVLYEGKTKLAELTKFFDSILDGSADLKPSKKEQTTDSGAPKDEL